MATVASKIPELIIPINAQVVLSLLLALVLAVLALIYSFVLDSQTTWTGTCRAGNWGGGSVLEISVDCGSQGKTDVSDANVIRSYLRNPGPFSCNRSAADVIHCQARQALRAKKN